MKAIKYLKITGAICIALLTTGNTLSQTPYFYQKGMYPEKNLTVFNNLIKTDLVSLASGDLILLYERRFTDQFGLEGGAGFLLQPTPISSFTVFAERLDNFKSNSGFSLQVSPRFYNWLFPDNLNCILVSVKQYNNLTIGEISYGFGYIFSLSDRFFIETSFYTGLIQQWSSKDNPNYLYKDALNFQMKLSVVVGFALN